MTELLIQCQNGAQIFIQKHWALACPSAKPDVLFRHVTKNLLGQGWNMLQNTSQSLTATDCHKLFHRAAKDLCDGP